MLMKHKMGSLYKAHALKSIRSAFWQTCLWRHKRGVSTMAVFEVGRVAVKTLGREAGYYCTVVEVIDHSFVLVEGLNVRRRRCNVRHLAPTPDKLDLKKGADLAAIKKAVKAAKLEEKFQNRIKLDL